MVKAITDLLTEGINVETLLTLLAAAAAIGVSLWLRGLIKKLIAFRKVRNSGRIAKDVVLRWNDNSANSFWRVTDIRFGGVWLQNRENESLEAWVPHQELLTAPTLFSRK